MQEGPTNSYLGAVILSQNFYIRDEVSSLRNQLDLAEALYHELCHEFYIARDTLASKKKKFIALGAAFTALPRPVYLVIQTPTVDEN